MNITQEHFQEVTGEIPVPSFGCFPAGITNQPLPESALTMHELIVVGPINGMFHLAYKIVGTDTYSSVSEFSSEAAAHREAGFMNASLNFPKVGG